MGQIIERPNWLRGILKSKKKEYVLGFALNNSSVILIRKLRPNWQNGKLNGIGGHIEKGGRSTSSYGKGIPGRDWGTNPTLDKDRDYRG